MHSKGLDLIYNPFKNKGTSFSSSERDKLELRGLIPPVVTSIQEEVLRKYEMFLRQKTPLAKNHFLIGLANTNATLFYRLFLDHVEEILPFVYTPTVGDAALEFNIYYQVPQRGVYISCQDKDHIDQIFSNVNTKQIDVIVVTDGQRILGLGDVGIGGMTIPVGKLALYTVFAGIHPEKTLPIFLDVGTNNQNLKEDPFYLGLRQNRLEGQEYDSFVASFIKAVKKAFTNVLLQWEDFGKNNAKRLLDCYQKEILSFNDDIQGTAATALTGILSANRAQKGELKKKNIVILGGGSAGLGIANLLIDYLVEYEKLDEMTALSRIYIVDRKGLISYKVEDLFEGQSRFQKSKELLEHWSVLNPSNISLHEVVENTKAQILIGVSGQANAFDQEILSAMAKNNERPIIFPLSNPTSKCEAHPKNILQICGSKALIATGSPFFGVEFEGNTYNISQCNNVYVFPSIGLAAIALNLTHIPNILFIEAAIRLMEKREQCAGLDEGQLFIPIKDLRKNTKEVAIGIGFKAKSLGLVDANISSIESAIAENIWYPEYEVYI